MRLDPGASRAEALSRLRAAFAAGGVAEPGADARLLLLDATGARAADLALAPEAPLGAAAAERLSRYAQARLARAPVWRILGAREFYGLTFRLSEAALVPRPDTEILVDVVLAARPDGAAARVVDLGVGSGAILVALLANRRSWSGVGVDLSAEACATARDNARANGVGARAAFAVGAWGGALAEGSVDVLVSNPPYVASAEIDGLEPEVRLHDPRLALDGGADGLDAYRAILADAPRLLAPGGLVAVEVGAGQAEAARAIGEAAGLRPTRVAADLGGVPRVVAFEREVPRRMEIRRAGSF